MANTPSILVEGKPRLIGLDLLRLSAIGLVLGNHMKPCPTDWPNIPSIFFAALLHGGWVGVDLFFVLSGFLVSGLLFQEFKSLGRLLRFYIRCGWKIYPSFYLLIATTIIVGIWRSHPITGLKIMAETLFLQSYIQGLWMHTWSLAVEEHFYFMLPLVLALIIRINGKSQTPLRPILVIAICLAVFCLGMRIANWYCRSSYSHMTHLFPTHLRLDSLFFGVAIAYFWHFHTVRFKQLFEPWRYYLIVCGMCLFAPAFILNRETSLFLDAGGLTLFYIASGMLLVGVLLCRIPESRPVVSMAAIGTFSYSIYLWHVPVAVWVIPAIEKLFNVKLAFGVWISMYLIGSIVLGIGMAKLVEFPALRLRDRWFPSRVNAKQS